MGLFGCMYSSQAGEVATLRKLLRKDSIQYLVDIGAHDGSSLSNSAFFIEAGWKAILIAPLPGPFPKLLKKYKDNPNVKCLNLAISDTKGIQDFFIGSDGPEGMLSTLCQDDNMCGQPMPEAIR